MDTEDDEEEAPTLVSIDAEEDEEEVVTFFPVDKMLHEQVHSFLEVGVFDWLPQIDLLQEHFFPSAPLSRSLGMSQARWDLVRFSNCLESVGWAI